MRDLVSLYRRAHNTMRNMDGLQPQEAFEELLKFLFYKQSSEDEALAPSTASGIRQHFASYLEVHNAWSTSLWRDRDFHLSDSCLEQISSLFSGVYLGSIDIDIRSTALREFLTPEVRKGLGIYLTPDEVVREMVRFVDPEPSAKCLDPACGSGTFLIELVKNWKNKHRESGRCEVWGADKNPRMLLLGELNLGHFPGVSYHRALMDSLTSLRDDHDNDWCRFEYFDFVLTNPPFGVVVKTLAANFTGYDTAFNADGVQRERQASELLFIEQSLRWLKPGGTLGIVLPRSVLTNPTFSYERAIIARLGFLKAVIQLPPETFLVTGAQTNTVVVFIEKYKNSSLLETKRKIDVVVSNISNVGYDSTGRSRKGSQLQGLAERMRDPIGMPCDYVNVLPAIAAKDTLEALSTTSVAKRRQAGGVPLGDLVSEIKTGRTPPRAAYAEDAGLFLIKVGNLTGSGVNWTPRDRNFIDTTSMSERKKGGFRLVQRDDILLTSSAHSPFYIAKKVDIITSVPEWVGGSASFVGEVMLLRAKADCVAAITLLAYLRQPSVAEVIQDMVRGQTAHLHPDDLASLRIPDSVLAASEEWQRLADLIEEEAKLNDRLNELANIQRVMMHKLADKIKAG